MSPQPTPRSQEPAEKPATPARDTALGDIARELAKKLSSWQALVVLLVIVVGLIMVQVSASPNAGVVIWAFVVLLVVGEGTALLLHRQDTPQPAKGLSPADRRAVSANLQEVRRGVARRLEMDEHLCRANVFSQVPGAKRLQIVDQLMANMDEVVEWDISVPIGRGATGIAWKTRKPTVVVFPPQGDEDLSPEESRRVHPHLKWIISVPIVVDSEVKWAINVDGEEDRDRDRLEEVVPLVQGTAGTLAPFAEKA